MSLSFSSNPVSLVWLNQYSLTLFLVKMSLTTHNFVYNYKRLRTLWKPCVKPHVKNPWFTVFRTNKVRWSWPGLPLLTTFQDQEVSVWFDSIMFGQTSLIGRRYFLAILQQFKNVNNGSNFNFNPHVSFNDVSYNKLVEKTSQLS